MKKIFVTGGAGFIGSAFVRLILDTTSDVQIINFDALKYSGLLENLSGVDSRRHEFVKGDICDREKVLDAMPTNVDAVFNFAAETHVDRSIESAEEFIRTNILGTQILLKASVEKEAKRYIQISTDEVFGSLDFDDEITFSENSPIAPKTLMLLQKPRRSISLNPREILMNSTR